MAHRSRRRLPELRELCRHGPSRALCLLGLPRAQRHWRDTGHRHPGGPTSTPLLAGRNELSVRIHNNGSGANPYGLIMQATLTYNCRIAPTAAATAVPVDAPWALAGMGALLAAGVAMSKRRRKSA